MDSVHQLILGFSLVYGLRCRPRVPEPIKDEISHYLQIFTRMALKGLMLGFAEHHVCLFLDLVDQLILGRPLVHGSRSF